MKMRRGLRTTFIVWGMFPVLGVVTVILWGHSLATWTRDHVVRYARWLNGCFSCRKCGRQHQLMCFGFGEAICPDCFEGEQPFIFYDQTFWLNRLTDKMQTRVASP